MIRVSPAFVGIDLIAIHIVGKVQTPLNQTMRSFCGRDGNTDHRVRMCRPIDNGGYKTGDRPAKPPRCSSN